MTPLRIAVPDDLPALDAKGVADAVRLLLSEGKITDATDVRLLTGALGFIDAPTEDIDEIGKHASNVGEVQGGYYQQGAEPPAEIDALDRLMQTYLCEYYLRTAKAEFTRTPLDIEKLKHAVSFAMDVAKTFKKRTGDATLLAYAESLQNAIPADEATTDGIDDSRKDMLKIFDPKTK